MIVSEEFEYIWESAAGVSFTVQNDTEMFVSRGSQARHEDHFLLGGGPVRVLGGTMLEGSGVDHSQNSSASPSSCTWEKSKEKEVTDSGENEDDNRGGR